LAKRTKIDAIKLKGRIFSGSGEAAEFIKLSWVKAQIIEKLGFIPYNGTLNVKLNEESLTLKRRFLKKAKPIQILPPKGFCSGTCFRAVFMDKLECAIVIPDVDGYPEDVIEIIAPINLREKFQLKDGDTAKVVIKMFN
jgi:riboflavin kinase